MNIISIPVPPYPYYVITGSALYRPGDKHQLRRNLGVFDLLFIEYGTLYMTEGSDVFSLKKNEMLILSPDQVHYGHKPTTEQTSFYWLHFHADSYTYTDHIAVGKKMRNETINVSRARESTLFLPRHHRFSEQEGQEVLNLLKNISSVSINKYKQNLKMLGHHFIEGLYGQEMLCQLLRRIQLNPDIADGKSPLAINVMNYIMHNYNRNITLEMLAEEFNFHPGYLIRCLKKEFGVTPIEALIRMRIDNSKHLLLYSDMSNAEIATSVGFASAAYFNRTFKSHTGLTPREFAHQKRVEG